MSYLRYSKVRCHASIVQRRKNSRSKEKKIVNEKKPESEVEDKGSKPIDKYSMKKVKKKERTSKCSYCSKVFHPQKKFFNNKMGIMSHLLENHNIEVPDELENPDDSLEHGHSVQLQGDINYALSARVK